MKGGGVTRRVPKASTKSPQANQSDDDDNNNDTTDFSHISVSQHHTFKTLLPSLLVCFFLPLALHSLLLHSAPVPHQLILDDTHVIGLSQTATTRCTLDHILLPFHQPLALQIHTTYSPLSSSLVRALACATPSSLSLPTWLRQVNIVLHSISSALCFLLITNCLAILSPASPPPALAPIVATVLCIFSFHPVSSIAVATPSALSLSLSLPLLLSCLLAYSYTTTTKSKTDNNETNAFMQDPGYISIKPLILSLLLLPLAPLTHSILLLPTPLLLLSFDLLILCNGKVSVFFRYLRNGSDRNALWIYGFVLRAFCVVFVWLIAVWIRLTKDSVSPPPFEPLVNPIDHIPFWFASLASRILCTALHTFYFLLPLPHSPLLSGKSVPQLTNPLSFSSVFICAFLLCAVWFLRAIFFPPKTRKRSKNDEEGGEKNLQKFAVLFCILTYLPVSGWLGHTHHVMDDSALYVPSAALALLLAALCCSSSSPANPLLANKRNLMYGLFAVVFFAYFVLLRFNINVYRSDETILETAIRFHPQNAKAHHLLALKTKDESIAEKHLREAVAIEPTFVVACYDLGAWLYSHDQVDEALDTWKQCITSTRTQKSVSGNRSILIKVYKQVAAAVGSHEKITALETEESAWMSKTAL